VRKFAAFLGRSPDTATSEDLRRYQLHMAQHQASPGTINAAIAALRFFFTVTLEKPDLVRPLRTVTKPRKAPIVLSQEEVARLLQAAPSLKYKAALSVAYGAGLRVSEVANLKVSDIDSGRMLLRVGETPSAASRALQFTILTVARSGETLGMTWDEVDFDAATWVIPANRMKMGKFMRSRSANRPSPSCAPKRPSAARTRSCSPVGRSVRCRAWRCRCCFDA
jgi:integrase